LTLAPAEDYDEVDAQVSDTVEHAWTEFARTGAPSSPDGTPWPAVSGTAPRLAVIDDKADSCPLDISPVTDLINSIRVSGS
jgi:para-nitrobenzyl esterase